MTKNFPLQFVSEEALQIVGQSWMSQHQAAPAKDQQRNLRLRSDLIAAYSSEIETHKWFLSEKLGRDVGFHVAAADYLENISPVKRDGWRESAKNIARSLGLLNLNFDGPNSLLNFERSMRGTSSLAR